MFVPTDNQGAGGWREVPVSKTHTAVVKQGDEGIGVSVYTFKGWKTWAQSSPAQRAKIPSGMAKLYGLNAPAGVSQITPASKAPKQADPLERYHTGGPWYEIDGERARGRQDALALLAKKEAVNAGEEG